MNLDFLYDDDVVGVGHFVFSDEFLFPIVGIHARGDKIHLTKSQASALLEVSITFGEMNTILPVEKRFDLFILKHKDGKVRCVCNSEPPLDVILPESFEAMDS